DGFAAHQRLGTLPSRHSESASPPLTPNVCLRRTAYQSWCREPWNKQRHKGSHPDVRDHLPTAACCPGGSDRALRLRADGCCARLEQCCDQKRYRFSVLGCRGPTTGTDPCDA